MPAPETEEQLAELVAATAHPVAICGGGTRGVNLAGEMLSTEKLSGITVFEPGALTLVAKAGTPLSEVEAALDAENQMLAFEPCDHRMLLKTDGEPTIGGVVATNSSGPRRVQSGACRDFLIGARFVDGTGTVIKSGGRVMKNVTGYDLARLMCGAHGTLGVLSEVALKVIPRPETEVTLTIEGLNPENAVDAMSVALSTPYEVTGAFFGPHYPGQSEAAHIRIEGAETSVKYRCQRLLEALAGFGDEIVVQEHSQSKAIWTRIRNMEMISDAAVVLKCHVAPSRANAVLQRNRVVGATDHLDWGGGRIWVSATDEQLVGIAERMDETKEDLSETAETLLSLYRDGVAVEQGHCTVVKAPAAVRERVHTFQPEAEPLASMARALRQKYDPRGILNPGLMD